MDGKLKRSIYREVRLRAEARAARDPRRRVRRRQALGRPPKARA
jgi:hypothetical protein